jgi:hypothetical protein
MRTGRGTVSFLAAAFWVISLGCQGSRDPVIEVRGSGLRLRLPKNSIQGAAQ